LINSNSTSNKAVIFDLDNTLLDRKKSLKTFSKKLLHDYVENDFSEEQMYTDILEADGDGYRNKEDIHQILLAKLPWKLSLTFAQFRDIWDTEFPRSSELMAGALEVLEFLTQKGYKVALITNGKSNVQNAKIDSAQIRKYFEVIHISNELGFKKPGKEIFQLTTEKLGVKPEDAFYIGDHPINDVFGAANAGLNAIWLSGFFDWDSTLKVERFITISLLIELIEIFE
jgi:putative hydrolase of the HAD superfamily